MVTHIMQYQKEWNQPSRAILIYEFECSSIIQNKQMIGISNFQLDHFRFSMVLGMIWWHLSKKPNWFSLFQLTYRAITAEVITKSIKNAKGINNTTYAKKLKRKSETKWLKRCERIQKNVCDIPRAPIRKSILRKKWTNFFALYYLIQFLQMNNYSS